MYQHRVKLILEFLKGSKRYFLGAGLAILVSVLMGFLTPLLLSFTIDSLIDNQPIQLPAFLMSIVDALGGQAVLRGELWIMGVLLVSLNAFSGVFMFLNGRLSADLSETVAERMRNRLYDHLQKLPYDYHVKAETGDLIQRCSSDVETVRRFLSMQLLQVIRSVFLVTFAIVIMVQLEPTLTFFAMCLVPFIFLFSLFFFRMVVKRFKSSDEAEGAMSATLQENLTGMRVVRAFGREQFEVDRFEVKNHDYYQKARKLITLMATYWSTSDLTAMFQTGIVWAVGIYFAATGRITVGTLVVFVSYEGMLLWPVRQLGRILSDMGKAFVSIDRIGEIIRQKPEERPEDNHLTPPIDREITFSNVTFHYEENHPVLEDVSFTAQPGQTIALLGPTGSGKSSLVHLLQRLYDPIAGTITIGGVDIKEIDRKHLREHVGIVLQEPFLYSKSVRENIGIVIRDATDEQIFGAARQASVHDVIEHFEKGYQTMVGERGVTLSGGQKQRVAIARTLLKENDVLIFDDSLSAVDTETDVKIRKALSESKGKVTTFIISHRVTTLMEADVILVLEQGRIVDRGTHAELIARPGLYERIYRIQSSLESEMEEEAREDAAK